MGKRSISETEPSDAQLAEAVQAGDLNAFAHLLEAHLSAVHAFISLKLPIAHLVDEITHETFVFAFHHLKEFSPGTSFRSWLRAIAANKVRAEIERYCREERNRLAYSEHTALDQALHSSADDHFGIETLRSCLDELPEHTRTLLQLKYQQEMSSGEVADQLRRSVAWVRTTLCRVRQQLRDCVARKLRTA